MPTTAERTPQRVGPRRLTLSKKARDLTLLAHTQAAHAHTFAALARPTVPKATAALAAAESQLGLGYAITSCRCSPYPCYKRDCSGLIYFAINRAFLDIGIPSNLCGSSFSLAAWGRDWGTGISEAEYLNTPFALAIRCPWCSPNAIGSNGHVVASRGDGKQTIEEGGHATGCYHGWATGRGFTFWMRVPSLDYTATPTRIGDIDMFAQTHHYDQKTGAITGPAEPAKEDAAESPVVRVADDGLSIVAAYGASIAGDHADDNNHPRHIRRWYPQRALPAGERFTGVAFRDATNAEPVPGGVATVSDGSTRKFRLS